MTNGDTLNIGTGNFDYISDKWNREMLENAWQAITLTNMWEFVKQDIDSFMFSLDPRLDIISEKMAEIGYNVHSGMTFGRTMRQMQYLAKFGEKKFKENFDTVLSVEHIRYSDQDADTDSDVESNPYPGEYTTEYEQRLKQLIKRKLEIEYYEKRDKEKKEAREKLLDYMGGY